MNTLKSKVSEAMAQLNLSQSALSIKLGRSKNALSEALRRGCTTEMQEQLIAEIDYILAGGEDVSVKGLLEDNKHLADQVADLKKQLARVTTERNAFKQAFEEKSDYASGWVKNTLKLSKKLNKLPHDTITWLAGWAAAAFIGFFVRDITNIICDLNVFSVILGSTSVSLLILLAVRWDQYQRWRKS